MSPKKHGCAVVVLLTAVVVLTLPILFLYQIGSYDRKTVRLAKDLAATSETQLREIYSESARIFSESSEADRESYKRLMEEDIPEQIRGLGFDRCYLTSEGVFYGRVGGGWSMSGTWIHSIHAPAGVDYDRKGISYYGLGTTKWVYEYDTTTQAEQAGGHQPPNRPESE